MFLNEASVLVKGSRNFGFGRIIRLRLLFMHGQSMHFSWTNLL
jgi:hypothetical protein